MIMVRDVKTVQQSFLVTLTVLPRYILFSVWVYFMGRTVLSNQASPASCSLRLVQAGCYSNKTPTQARCDTITAECNCGML